MAIDNDTNSDKDQIRISERSEWIQDLPNHPIFQLSPEELEQWQKKNAPSIAVDSQFSHSSNIDQTVASVAQQLSGMDVGDNPPGRISNLALRDADALVAIGSSIRIASLSEAKKRRMENKEDFLEKFQTLDVSIIDYEIRSLEVNPLGKLMAVVGDKELVVVVLPRAGYFKLVEESISCRAYRVGDLYHRKGAASNIVKVAWHPLAEGGMGLLVLTSDGILRLYDVSRDVTDPEQEFSIGNVANRQRREPFTGFSANFEDEAEAASFCLGTGGADWGPLTAYVLLRNGNVYSICPVLPRSAIVNRSLIRVLATVISTKCDGLANIAKDKPEAYAHMLEQYRMQSKWITPLLKQSLEPPKRGISQNGGGELEDDLVKVDGTSVIRYPPLVQGPYLMKPSPVELSDEEPLACDILYLETEPVPTLAIVYSNGKIDVCLEVEKAEGRWASKGAAKVAAQDLPCLLVYESIDLGLLEVAKNNKKIGANELIKSNGAVLVPDLVYYDTFYCYHRFGAHSINLGGWLHELNDIERHDDNEEEQKRAMKSFLHRKKKSSVSWVVDTMVTGSTPSPAVTALCIVNDVYLSYSMLILTSALQLVAFELSLRLEMVETPSDRMSVDPYHIDMSIVNDDPYYISLLQKPPFRPSEILEKLQHRGRIILPPNQKDKLDINEDTLRYLGKKVDEYRGDMRTLMKAGNASQQRLSLQMEELRRQLSKLQEVNELHQSLVMKQKNKIQERFQRLSDDQKKLLKRADHLLQGMIDIHEPTLSHAEEAWFSELRKLQRYVQNDNGLEMRVKRAQEQLDTIKKDFPQIIGSKNGNEYEDLEGMGRSQLSQIESMLEHESDLMDMGMAKVQTLASRLEKHYGIKIDEM